MPDLGEDVAHVAQIASGADPVTHVALASEPNPIHAAQTYQGLHHLDYAIKNQPEQYTDTSKFYNWKNTYAYQQPTEHKDHGFNFFHTLGDWTSGSIDFGQGVVEGVADVAKGVGSWAVNTAKGIGRNVEDFAHDPVKWLKKEPGQITHNVGHWFEEGIDAIPHLYRYTVEYAHKYGWNKALGHLAGTLAPALLDPAAGAAALGVEGITEAALGAGAAVRGGLTRVAEGVKDVAGKTVRAGRTKEAVPEVVTKAEKITGDADLTTAVEDYHSLVEELMTVRESLAKEYPSGNPISGHPAPGAADSVLTRYQQYMQEENRLAQEVKDRLDMIQERVNPITRKAAKVGVAVAKTAKAVTAPVWYPLGKGLKYSTSTEALVGEVSGMAGAEGSPDHDLWHKTADGAIWADPFMGRHATMGQSLFHLFTSASPEWAKSLESPFQGLVSGAIDFSSQLIAPDPFGAAGDIYAKARTAEGADGFLAHKLFSGIAVQNADDIERLASKKHGIFSKVCEKVADMNGLQIAEAYKSVPDVTPELAVKLGEAKTKEEVIQVFGEAANSNAFLSGVAPTFGNYTLGKIKYRQWIDKFNQFTEGKLPEFVGKTEGQFRRAQIKTGLMRMFAQRPYYLETMTKDGEGTAVKILSLGKADPNSILSIIRILRQAGESEGTLDLLHSDLARLAKTDDREVFHETVFAAYAHLAERQLLWKIGRIPTDEEAALIKHQLQSSLRGIMKKTSLSDDSLYSGGALSELDNFKINADTGERIHTAGESSAHLQDMRLLDSRDFNTFVRQFSAVYENPGWQEIKDGLTRAVENMQDFQKRLLANPDIYKARDLQLYLENNMHVNPNPFGKLNGVDTVYYKASAMLKGLRHSYNEVEALVRFRYQMMQQRDQFERRLHELHLGAAPGVPVPEGEDLLRSTAWRPEEDMMLAEVFWNYVCTNEIIREIAIRTSKPLEGEKKSMWENYWESVVGSTKQGYKSSAERPAWYEKFEKGELPMHQDMEDVLLHGGTSTYRAQRDAYYREFDTRANLLFNGAGGWLTRGQQAIDNTNHIVNNLFFKAMTLSSQAWAWHVSISEAMLNLFRNGAIPTFSSHFAMQYAKKSVRYSLDQAYNPRMRTWTRNAVGGLLMGVQGHLASSLMGKRGERLLEDAMDIVMTHPSAIHPALSATHGGSSAMVSEDRGRIDLGPMNLDNAYLSNKFVNYQNHQPEMARMWHQYVSHTLSTPEHVWIANRAAEKIAAAQKTIPSDEFAETMAKRLYGLDKKLENETKILLESNPFGVLQKIERLKKKYERQVQLIKSQIPAEELIRIRKELENEFKVYLQSKPKVWRESFSNNEHLSEYAHNWNIENADKIAAGTAEAYTPISDWARISVKTNMNSWVSHFAEDSSVLDNGWETLENSVFHPFLLEQISQKNLHPLSEVADYHEFCGKNTKSIMGVSHPKLKNAFPDNIPGPEIQKTKTLASSATALQRLADAGHRKFFGPFVDWMSRQPTYLWEYHKEMELLRGKVHGIAHTLENLSHTLKLHPEEIEQHIVDYRDLVAKRVAEYLNASSNHRVLQFGAPKAENPALNLDPMDYASQLHAARTGRTLEEDLADHLPGFVGHDFDTLAVVPLSYKVSEPTYAAQIDKHEAMLDESRKKIGDSEQAIRDALSGVRVEQENAVSTIAANLKIDEAEMHDMHRRLDELVAERENYQPIEKVRDDDKDVFHDEVIKQIAKEDTVSGHWEQHQQLIADLPVIYQMQDLAAEHVRLTDMLNSYKNTLRPEFKEQIAERQAQIIAEVNELEKQLTAKYGSELDNLATFPDKALANIEKSFKMYSAKRGNEGLGFPAPVEGDAPKRFMLLNPDVAFSRGTNEETSEAFRFAAGQSDFRASLERFVRSNDTLVVPNVAGKTHDNLASKAETQWGVNFESLQSKPLRDNFKPGPQVWPGGHKVIVSKDGMRVKTEGGRVYPMDKAVYYYSHLNALENADVFVVYPPNGLDSDYISINAELVRQARKKGIPVVGPGMDSYPPSRRIAVTGGRPGTYNMNRADIEQEARVYVPEHSGQANGGIYTLAEAEKAGIEIHRPTAALRKAQKGKNQDELVMRLRQGTGINGARAIYEMSPAMQQVIKDAARKPGMGIVVRGKFKEISMADEVRNAIRKHLKPGDILVHGDANGVDKIAAEEAIKMGIRTEAHPVTAKEWAQQGRVAGPLRNQRMIKSGLDHVISFPGGAGTTHMVAASRDAGIPVISHTARRLVTKPSEKDFEVLNRSIGKPKESDIKPSVKESTDTRPSIKDEISEEEFRLRGEIDNQQKTLDSTRELRDKVNRIEEINNLLKLKLQPETDKALRLERKALHDELLPPQEMLQIGRFSHPYAQHIYEPSELSSGEAAEMLDPVGAGAYTPIDELKSARQKAIDERDALVQRIQDGRSSDGMLPHRPNCQRDEQNYDGQCPGCVEDMWSKQQGGRGARPKTRETVINEGNPSVLESRMHPEDFEEAKYYSELYRGISHEFDAEFGSKQAIIRREFAWLMDTYYPEGVFNPSRMPTVTAEGNDWAQGSHAIDQLAQMLRDALHGHHSIAMAFDAEGHIAGAVSYKLNEPYGLTITGVSGTLSTPGAVEAVEHHVARYAQERGMNVTYPHNDATIGYHNNIGRSGMDWHGHDPVVGNGTGISPEKMEIMDGISPWFKYHAWDNVAMADRLKEYKQAREMAMSTEGDLTLDQAKIIAQQRAAERMLGYVHNPPEKTALEHALRVAAPFYFAQNQAWRRAFRLMASDPGAFERYLKANLAIANYASNHQINGMSMTSLPGSQVMGMGVGMILNGQGLDFGLSGSLASTKSMMLEGFTGDSTQAKLSNFLPAFGPVVTIPSKTVLGLVKNSLDAAHQKQAANKVLAVQNFLSGEFGKDKSVWTDFVPNTLLRNIAEGLMSGLSHDTGNMWGSSYSSTRNQVAIELAQNMYNDIAKNFLEKGGLGYSSDQMRALRANSNTAAQFWSMVMTEFARKFANPTEMDSIAKQANRNTAVMWAIKTLASFSSPLSTSLEKSGLRWGNVLVEYINEHGPLLGYQMFAKDHPDHTIESVFMSNSPTGVVYPESAAALKFLDKHSELATPDKYGSIMGYLIPRRGKNEDFSHEAFTMELNLGLRKRAGLMSNNLAVPGVLQTISINAGNTWYYNNIMRKANISLGIDPDSPSNPSVDGARQQQLSQEAGIQFGIYANSPAYLRQVMTWEKDQILQYSTFVNPIWGQYHAFNYQQKNALHQYTKFQELFKNIDTYETIYQSMDSKQKSMLDNIKQLMTDYQQATNTYQQLKANGRPTSTLDQSWYNYLTNIAKNQVILAPIVNTLFKHLPMQGALNG